MRQSRFERRRPFTSRPIFHAEAVEPRRLLSAIASDQTVTGTLATPTQVDSYTFDAAAGQSIYAAAAETVAGSPLNVTITLLAPNGSVAKSASSPTGTSVFAPNISQAGTYTLQISGQFGSLGSYAATLALAGVAPVGGTDAGPIASGAYHTAAITVGDIDVYTISGTAGGSLLAAIGDLDPASPFNPELDIFSPSGGRLQSAASPIGTNILITNLPATGTYYVIASDQFSNNTGTYALSVATFGGTQVTDADSGPFPSGAYKTGTIDVGDFDTYTISGTTGGSLLAAVGDLDPKSPFNPDILIFSPTGALLGNAASPVGTNDLEQKLTATGTYYVVVIDQFSNQTGTYGLSVATFGGTQITDADSGPINSGEYKTGSIVPGDFDVYTISATAGGSLLGAIGDLDPTSAFNPDILIFSPTGALLGSAASPVGNSILQQKLPATGTYYVVAIDQFSNQTGNYGLSVARFGGSQNVSFGDEGGSLASGAYHTGVIAPGDFDTYTVSAQAGQTIVAAMGDLDSTSPFNPQLLLFSPTGDLLESPAGPVGTSFLHKSLPATGTYAVVAIDQFGNNTGRYGLTTDVVGGSATQTISPGDEGGPLNSAERRLGQIVPGDIDAYTFNLAAGNGAFWELGETVENNFSPQLIILGPSGNVLSNSFASHGQAYALPTAGAATAGTYTALVLDSSGGQSGEYAVTGVAVPATQTADDDGGTLAAGQPRAGALPPGDADVYTVAATAGQKLTFNLAQTGTGSLTPLLIVYRPDGSIAGINAGGNSAQVVVNSAAAGTYTVVVADNTGQGSGAYSIGLNTPAGADTFAPKLLESAYRFNDSTPSVRLAFSEDVSASFQPDSFVLKNLTTGQTIDPADLSITFTHYANEIYLGTSPLPGGVLPDGNYHLSIPAAKLTDVAGNALGQDVSLDFYVLAGDANRDRKVNFSDLLILAQNYNGTGRSFSQGDFNYDGKVNFGDLLILAQQYNHTVPPPAAATAPDLLHAAAKKARNLASPLLH